MSNLLDEELRIAGEVDAVLMPVDPEGCTQLAWTRTQIMGSPRGGPAHAHAREFALGLQRANKHGDGLAGFASHHVHAMVQTVDLVDVGVPSCQPHAGVAFGTATTESVGRPVAYAQVGLGLDDESGRATCGGLVNQALAQEGARDNARVTREEVAAKAPFTHD